MAHFHEVYEVTVCDVCERPRAQGCHRRCSRIRQQRFASRNAAKRRGRPKSSGGAR